MIKVNNLSLKFDDKIFFDNISFSIPQNKITMIIGANGTGKTTLMQVLTKNLKPENIEIKNDFKNIFYLPQKISYPKGISAFEYASSIFYKKTFKWYLTKEEKNKIYNAFETLEIEDKSNISIDKLSAGELQKLNISIGLISNADLFLLDEPLSNIDLVNQIKVLEITKKIKNDVTCAMITHDLNLSSRYGDYFIGIKKNHTIIEGEKSEFFKENILKEIFEVNFKIINNEGNFYVQAF